MQPMPSQTLPRALPTIRAKRPKEAQPILCAKADRLPLMVDRSPPNHRDISAILPSKAAWVRWLSARKYLISNVDRTKAQSGLDLYRDVTEK
jgi:hypothetical protein